MSADTLPEAYRILTAEEAGPLPPRGSVLGRQWGLSGMLGSLKVGEALEVTQAVHKLNALDSIMRYAAKRHGYKLSRRGLRIWRTE